MKKLLLAIFILIFVKLQTFAYDFIVDGIAYDIDGINVTVTSGGDYIGNINIPDSVTNNGITYKVTTIGVEAFYACSELSEVTIPNSVTSIEENAFYCCNNLSNLAIPNSVVSIGKQAFYLCNSLTYLAIPKSVTRIGEMAFCECSSLSNITVENGNNSYDSRNNCNAIIETATNTLITGCKSSVIPNTIIKIGDWAFYMCKDLTDVIIPNSVISIGDHAFHGCIDITEIAIPNSVTSIGNGAFMSCSNLTNVIIPSSVISIGKGAFLGCRGVENIYSYSKTDDVFLGEGVFTLVPISSCIIHVKPEYIEGYIITPQWQDFNNIVGDLNDENIKGDLDGNGIIDVEDVNALINIILKLKSISDYPGNGDMDSNGIIDVEDVNAIINIILKLINPNGIVEEFTVNGVSFKMVKVEGGTFTMGASVMQLDDAFDIEYPAHRVSLSDYYIGATEVTQELWLAVMGNNPSEFTQINGYAENLQRPVEKITWQNCKSFLSKLNQLTGKSFRLPTEAEWEFAARGGNKSHGYKYAGSNNIENSAWYWYNIPSQSNNTEGYGTQTVGTKYPNELVYMT